MSSTNVAVTIPNVTEIKKYEKCPATVERMRSIRYLISTFIIFLTTGVFLLEVRPSPSTQFPISRAHHAHASVHGHNRMGIGDNTIIEGVGGEYLVCAVLDFWPAQGFFVFGIGISNLSNLSLVFINDLCSSGKPFGQS